MTSRRRATAVAGILPSFDDPRRLLVRSDSQPTLSAIRIWSTAARLRYWLRIYPDVGAHAILVAMPEQTDFDCPTCGVLHKLPRAGAPTANDKPLTCLSCGGSLLNRDGKFALKYFRTNGGPGHRSRI